MRKMGQEVLELENKSREPQIKKEEYIQALAKTIAPCFAGEFKSAYERNSRKDVFYSLSTSDLRKHPVLKKKLPLIDQPYEMGVLLRAVAGELPSLAKVYDVCSLCTESRFGISPVGFSRMEAGTAEP